MTTAIEADNPESDQYWNELERRMLAALRLIRSAGLVPGEHVIVLFDSARPAARAVATFISELVRVPICPAIDGLVVSRRVLGAQMPDEWRLYRFMLEAELAPDEIRLMLANETGVLFINTMVLPSERMGGAA